MNANRKIVFIVFTLVAILTAIIIAFVSINQRSTGYDGAKKRAYLTAEIVKNSLTAHMVNGMMNERHVFLDSMKRLKNVEDLWVVRAPSVSEQFGIALADESPRDEIDKEVLQSGIEKAKTTESLKRASLRVTIPYIASSFDKPNCLECHNAKEGDVLGAISVKFDIQDDRVEGLISISEILIISIVFLVLILIIISRMIKPYTAVFDSMIQALKRVHEGDYSVRVKEGSFSEDKEASKWLNDIVEKLETVLGGIEKNLTAFVHNRRTIINNDKLLTAQEIIQDIADIYNFKKTIETDGGKEDIYFRLAQVLKNHLNIQNFVIFEDDYSKDTRTIVELHGNNGVCCEIDKDIKGRCRAERTDQVVQSTNFPEICRFAKCQNGEVDYVCIPYQISDDKSIIISIICANKEELQNSKYQIGIIKKYLEEAKPILESRMLMDVLRERSYIDGLTGLYNRKYLDDLIDKNLEDDVKNGVEYAIMLLDIDYFKMVNDTYGHDAGDSILKKLSSVMRECIGENDAIIRFGGEEFLILMKNCTEDSSLELATKINKSFKAIFFKFDNETFSKTVSIGYAIFPKDTDQIWKCIKFADLSLYKAKESGRDRVVRFDSSLLKDSVEKY